MEERLQKIVARAGLTSRRKAEVWIKDGRVTVNGLAVKELGSKADLERDEVRVDGALIGAAPAPVYLMLHKPEGYVTTTSDPEGRPTVMDLVKRVGSRVYPVGRLDFFTSGLLLMTSDGDLARFLTHPSSKVKKTYEVKVRDRIPWNKTEELAKGPRIGGPPLKPAEVKFLRPSRSGRHSWILMTITEGRTRQIRLMCEAVGHPVIKLKRVSVGPIRLGKLERGEFRQLSDREIESVKTLMKKAKKK